MWAEKKKRKTVTPSTYCCVDDALLFSERQGAHEWKEGEGTYGAVCEEAIVGRISSKASGAPKSGRASNSIPDSVTAAHSVIQLTRYGLWLL